MIYEATCLETLQQSQCGQQDLPVSATRWVLLKSHNGNCQHRQSHYIFYQGNFTFSHYTTSFHGRFVTFSIIYLFFFFGDGFGCPASLLFFLQAPSLLRERGSFSTYGPCFGPALRSVILNVSFYIFWDCVIIPLMLLYHVGGRVNSGRKKLINIIHCPSMLPTKMPLEYRNDKTTGS